MTQNEPLAIEVRDLCKRYPSVRPVRDVLLHPRSPKWIEALRGLDLEVHPGEVFGIIGANGAGKTSLIKILATLVLPSSGSARVFGKDVAKETPDVLTRLGLVLADERSFYWRLTVRQNLMFFSVLNEIPVRERAGRIDELIEIVGIRTCEHRPFRNLSSGFRQRVALARALLTDPDLLLMDEPTSSLDMRAAEEFRTWIREELVERRGKTILLVTHIASEAEELCSRIGLLRNGKLETLGSPSEIRTSRAGLASYRLRVTAWTQAIADELRASGALTQVDDRECSTSGEVVLHFAEEGLGPALELCLRRGVRIHDCNRESRTLSNILAGMLAPDAEPS